MQTHHAKRVEIIIEAPMETRLTAALEKAGVTGFTVLPVLGGSGRSGRWTREGQVGRAGMSWTPPLRWWSATSAWSASPMSR